MNTVTAIEMINEKHKQHVRQTFLDVQLILKQSLANGWGASMETAEEVLGDKFDFDLVIDNSMSMNIDELFFEVDGVQLVDWFKRHFVTHLESDKQITITLK